MYIVLGIFIAIITILWIFCKGASINEDYYSEELIVKKIKESDIPKKYSDTDGDVTNYKTINK